MTERSDEGGTLKTQSATIMVIEPDILVRMVIAEYLRECGYTVIEGVSGEDALAILQAGRVIDTLLSEVRLPGKLDGFSLARHIRGMHPEIDVILTSAIANAADKAGDLCDDGPLEKPYHPQDVIRRINILRARRRTARKP